MFNFFCDISSLHRARHFGSAPKTIVCIYAMHICNEFWVSKESTREKFKHTIQISSLYLQNCGLYRCIDSTWKIKWQPSWRWVLMRYPWKGNMFPLQGLLRRLETSRENRMVRTEVGWDAPAVLCILDRTQSLHSCFPPSHGINLTHWYERRVYSVQ